MRLSIPFAAFFFKGQLFSAFLTTSLSDPQSTRGLPSLPFPLQLHSHRCCVPESRHLVALTQREDSIRSPSHRSSDANSLFWLFVETLPSHRGQLHPFFLPSAGVHSCPGPCRPAESYVLTDMVPGQLCLCSGTVGFLRAGTSLHIFPLALPRGDQGRICHKL